jgi:hypothetical protein
MIAPMLSPSESELRAVHRAQGNPFARLPYAEARPALRRWFVSRKLNQALTAFFQNARGRLNLTLLEPLSAHR